MRVAHPGDRRVNGMDQGSGLTKVVQHKAHLQHPDYLETNQQDSPSFPVRRQASHDHRVHILCLTEEEIDHTVMDCCL